MRQVELDRDTELLARLSLEEKVSLLSSQDDWSLPALPAIGLESLVMSDGPTGIKHRGAEQLIPSGTALAASWSPELVEALGSLLGENARATGRAHRGPRSIRGQPAAARRGQLQRRPVLGHVAGRGARGGRRAGRRARAPGRGPRRTRPSSWSVSVTTARARASTARRSSFPRSSAG